MDSVLKLQPHRTMALQGFDDYGAAAALWGASDTGFTVSGVFRDLADFAVLVLFQKDDPFGHPRFSYQNLSFVSPAISASHTTTDQAMWWQGNAAYNHWVTMLNRRLVSAKAPMPLPPTSTPLRRTL